MAVDVPASGIVADLSRAYAQQIGSSGRYSIAFQGETLKSKDALADTELSAEAIVEVVADVFTQYPGIALLNLSSTFSSTPTHQHMLSQGSNHWLMKESLRMRSWKYWNR